MRLAPPPPPKTESSPPPSRPSARRSTHDNSARTKSSSARSSGPAPSPSSGGYEDELTAPRSSPHRARRAAAVPPAADPAPELPPICPALPPLPARRRDPPAAERDENLTTGPTVGFVSPESSFERERTPTLHRGNTDTMVGAMKEYVMELSCKKGDAVDGLTAVFMSQKVRCADHPPGEVLEWPYTAGGGGGGSPSPPPYAPPSPTQILRLGNLFVPFLVHKRLGPRPTPPSPHLGLTPTETQPGGLWTA